MKHAAFWSIYPEQLKTTSAALFHDFLRAVFRSSAGEARGQTNLKRAGFNLKCVTKDTGQRVTMNWELAFPMNNVVQL